jgi:subtilisin family serine protease
MNGSATLTRRPGAQPVWLTPLRLLAVVAMLATLVAVATAPAVAATGDGALTSVIVRKQAGAGTGPEQLVERLGGRVQRQLGIIGGFSALVPAGDVAFLRTVPGITEVSENSPVTLNGTFDGVEIASRIDMVNESAEADEYWKAGFTGKGVGVAVIDSGVAPVAGLNASGKVIHGPDLSFESQNSTLRYMDTFGHGTAMAGIIAGKDAAVTTVTSKSDEDHFVGVAPDARILSVKVADQGGATDVSQVIAAIDWVVQHRNDNGMNIKVLNLSFGTDGTQDYKIDPLAYATEVAWRAGITVVVSAGNAGYGSAALNNPAYDPFVIAVGAADTRGTEDNDDDIPATFSSAGDTKRKPDFMAPGQSIASLRVPGSGLDELYPAARRGTRFFRGSGTSQAAAAVSGLVALVAQQHPTATPDQIKKLLKTAVDDTDLMNVAQSGAGEVDMSEALFAPLPTVSASAQTFTKSTGTGKLDLSRGTEKLVNDGVTLTGEKDVMGKAFSSSTWAPKAGKTAWSGGTWNGSTWAGTSWSSGTWTTGTWTATSWSGRKWTSINFTGRKWTGSAWTGTAWTGSNWSGRKWTSATWSSAGWS